MFMSSEFDLENQINHLVLNPRQKNNWDLINHLKKDQSISVFDEIELQVAELFKLKNPTQTFSKKELESFVDNFFEDKDKDLHGNWVYYPWSKSLVHVLEENEYSFVRTSRNKYKITEEEQKTMLSKKIGVVGLSVGQSVATCLAMERAFGELRIADFDTLELSNMNRIRTKVSNLGLTKTQIVVREIAEIDPYLKVVVFDEGLTDSNIDDFFSLDGDLDLLIEECDSLEMKLKARIKAKSLGIPVIMDTSDRGMIDIERFDLNSQLPIFHGMLAEFGNEEDLIEKLQDQKNQILMTVLDFPNLSESAKYSISEIGKSITTWPQLASSVLMGGAICSYYAKLILCKQTNFSGRFYVDLDQFIIMGHESKN